MTDEDKRQAALNQLSPGGRQMMENAPLHEIESVIRYESEVAEVYRRGGNRFGDDWGIHFDSPKRR